MKPIFVLYEGSHDSAFLGRLLIAANVKPFGRTLGKYEPAVLRNFLIKRHQERKVEEGRFRSSGSNQGTFVQESLPILSAAYELTAPPRLLLFHRCIGDNHEAVRGFLADLVALAQPGAPDVGLPSFGVLFVRDANDLGVDAKVAELQREFAEVLNPVLPGFVRLSANAPPDIIRDGDFSAGCCIFTGPGKTTGTLEEIIWPLLESQIPERLKDAREYVEAHGLAGTEVARGDKSSIKRVKAALTIAGQMDAPGCSLAVALREMPSFDDGSLSSDSICQMLTQMILAM